MTRLSSRKLFWLFAAVGMLTNAGCYKLSDTVISESTAPSSLGSSKNPSITGRHRIVVIGERIRSRSYAEIRKAAVAEGKRRCADFAIDDETFRTGDDATSQMARIKGTWIEMDIVCADVPREKMRGSATVVIEEESKDLPDSSFFDIHAEIFSADFDRVFEAVTKTLTDQGDRIYKADKDRGFIITGRARHGMIGFPIYEQYVVVVDEMSARESKVTFKLLVHSPNFNVGGVADMPPADRKFVYRRAAAFVDRIKAILRR